MDDAFCGNRVCDTGENCSTCAGDCTCAGGQSCTPAGVCCTPQCSGKTCGGDGCGNTCGTCAHGYDCTSQGTCVLRIECGNGVCQAGENCGNCPNDCKCDSGQTCNVNACCRPQCSGKNCGDDACGGSCGTCSNGYVCQSGLCTQQSSCGNGTCEPLQGENCESCADCKCSVGTCYNKACCTPQCSGKTCGPDGCGGSCGPACGPGLQCVSGNCKAVCQDQVCGPGENCSTCPSDCACPAGPCVQGFCCQPVQCGVEWACGSGDDGCGNIIDCGLCPDKLQECDANHQCGGIIVCDVSSSGSSGPSPDSILPPPTCCGALPCAPPVETQ
jgi:hypothetical protein